MLELFLAVFRAYLYKQCAHLLAYVRANVCMDVVVSNVNKLNATYMESRQRWYSTYKKEEKYIYLYSQSRPPQQKYFPNTQKMLFILCHHRIK